MSIEFLLREEGTVALLKQVLVGGEKKLGVVRCKKGDFTEIGKSLETDFYKVKQVRLETSLDFFYWYNI